MSERIGQQELGDWPQVFRERTGALRIDIPRYQPAHITHATIIGSLSLLAFLFIAFGVSVSWNNISKNERETVCAVAAALFLVVCSQFGSMKKHDRSKKKAVIQICKGKIHWRSKSCKLADLHSATVCAHRKTRDEARRNERRKREQQTYLYRDSSEIRLHYGIAGAQSDWLVEFCNDPDGRWAARARAAIDYAITIAATDMAAELVATQPAPLAALFDRPPV